MNLGRVIPPLWPWQYVPLPYSHHPPDGPFFSFFRRCSVLWGCHDPVAVLRHHRRHGRHRLVGQAGRPSPYTDLMGEGGVDGANSLLRGNWAWAGYVDAAGVDRLCAPHSSVPFCTPHTLTKVHMPAAAMRFLTRRTCVPPWILRSYLNSNLLTVHTFPDPQVHSDPAHTRAGSAPDRQADDVIKGGRGHTAATAVDIADGQGRCIDRRAVIVRSWVAWGSDEHHASCMCRPSILTEWIRRKDKRIAAGERE